MNTNGSDQRATYNAVSARGYTVGWTKEQFAARQALKLIEEVAELAECIKVVDLLDDDAPTTERFVEMMDHLRAAAAEARHVFDDRDMVEVSNGPEFAKELADVQVVVFCAAEALGISSSVMALQKSQADVARGVRVL